MRWILFYSLLSLAIAAPITSTKTNLTVLDYHLSETRFHAFADYKVIEVENLQEIESQYNEYLVNYRTDIIFHIKDQNSILFINNKKRIKNDGGAKLGDAIEVNSEGENFKAKDISWWSSPKKTVPTTMIKLDKTESKTKKGYIPVSVCLDLTEAPGGSISVSHGITITNSIDKENDWTVSLLLALTLKKTISESVEKSYSHTVTGTIPELTKGQLFIKNPPIFSATFKTIFYDFKEKFKKTEEEEDNITLLDPTVPFEYHLLTSDSYHLKCDA